jgi:hypothetical protein
LILLAFSLLFILIEGSSCLFLGFQFSLERKIEKSKTKNKGKKKKKKKEKEKGQRKIETRMEC